MAAMLSIKDPRSRKSLTGTHQLFPDDPVYASVTELEAARPWSAARPSAHADHISPDLLVKDPTWVAQPGSTRFPGFGVPGPRCRKGLATVDYDYGSRVFRKLEDYHAGKLLGTLSSSASLGSLPHSTLHSTLNSMSGSPSLRSLRLDSRAAQRRPASALAPPLASRTVWTPQPVATRPSPAGPSSTGAGRGASSSPVKRGRLRLTTPPLTLVLSLTLTLASCSCSTCQAHPSVTLPRRPEPRPELDSGQDARRVEGSVRGGPRLWRQVPLPD